MEYQDYPNTGKLMRTKEKKTQSSPDMWGEIKFDKAFLLDLVENSTEQLVSVRLSGWTKESQAGNKYLSISVNTFKPQEDRVRQVEQDDDIPF